MGDPTTPMPMKHTHRRRTRLRAAAHALLAVTAFSSASGSAAARADDTKPRPLPDYNGRGGSPTTVGDVALWVPRIIFYPVYLLTEYVIRKPLGFLVKTGERDNWVAAIQNFFTFDKDHKVGFTPSAFLDFGLRPSVGLYFFWDDFIKPGNDLRLYGATWGKPWLAFSIADRMAIGPRDEERSVTLRASFVRREDWVFHGLGPRSLEAHRSRYSSDAIDVGGLADVRMARATYLHSAAGVRGIKFEEPADHIGGDPTIGEGAAAGYFPLPPGFQNGYLAAYSRVQVSVDTRRKWPAEGSGVRVAVLGEPAFDLRRNAPNDAARSWVKYGATVGGYVDLTGTRRTVGLVLATEFVDPITKGDVPFTEQSTLGGFGFLRGYRPGRLVGRSSLVAQLEYRWPIWMWLDGSLQGGVGNVYGPGLAELSPKLLRMSGSVGIRTSNSADHQFEVLVGGGTETFEQGAKLSSIRIFFGTTRGF